jgi:hypothetical protein
MRSSLLSSLVDLWRIMAESNRGGVDFCHMRNMVLEYESQDLPEENHPVM